MLPTLWAWHTWRISYMWSSQVHTKLSHRRHHHWIGYQRWQSNMAQISSEINYPIRKTCQTYYAFGDLLRQSIATRTDVVRSIQISGSIERERRRCKVENILDIQNAIIHHCSLSLSPQSWVKFQRMRESQLLLSWRKNDPAKIMILNSFLILVGIVLRLIQIVSDRHSEFKVLDLPFYSSPFRLGAWMCIRNMAWRMRGGQEKLAH